MVNARRNNRNGEDGENGRNGDADAAAAAAAAAANLNGAFTPEMAAGMAAMFQTMMTQMMQQAMNGGGGPRVPPPPPPPGPDYLTYLDKMVKYKTGKFSGGVQPIEADEWRTELERNLELLHVPAEHHKDIAAFHLSGDAYEWWKSVERRDPEKVHNYESFKEEFNMKYFPRETRDKLVAEFLELRQGSRTVRDYEAKFNRLKKYGGRDAETEQDQIARFLRGIKPEIRTVIAVRDYDTLGQLVEKAALVETNQEEEAKASRSRKNQDRGKAKVADHAEDQLNEDDVRKLCATCGRVHSGICRWATGACLLCGSLDHVRRDCPNRGVRPRGGQAVECFKCGELGHYANECKAQANGQGQARGERRGEALPPPPKRARVNMIEVGEQDADRNVRED